MNRYTVRNSSIERLKILAVVFIILCHAVPDALSVEGYAFYGGGAMPYADANYLFAAMVSGLGLVGDVIFIVCSSWFLLDTKRVKINKVVSMILNVFIVSIIYLAIFLALGYKLSPMTIVRQCFPTIFQNNWFISYYIVFYLLHPLFNIIIEALDKKRLAIVSALLFVHCSILLFVIGEPPGINKFLCFVNIYFIVAYFKLYGAELRKSKKLNLIVCILSAVLYFAFRFALNFVGLKISFFEGRLLAYVHINNPIIIAFAISLFNLANMRAYTSKPVNYLSSLSMLVYIIHKNNLFSEFVQPLWFEWFIGKLGIAFFPLGILSLAAIYFAGSVLLASCYRFTVERAVGLISNKIERLFLTLYDKIVNLKENKADR